MTDLISRKAVFDIINKEWTKRYGADAIDDDQFYAVDDFKEEIKSQISSLPPSPESARVGCICGKVQGQAATEGQGMRKGQMGDKGFTARSPHPLQEEPMSGVQAGDLQHIPSQDTLVQRSALCWCGQTKEYHDKPHVTRICSEFKEAKR